MFLSDTNSIPSHHKLPDHTSMITTLLIMEFDSKRIGSELIESHIKRALSG